MKPIELTLKNIGPFYHTKDKENKTEHIDFSNLNDIFLIRGETGSGKSTIFDAILYALYGVSGAGSHEGRELSLRSDFAPIDEPSSVDFTFQMNSNICRVYRTFSTMHTTKSGKVVSNNDGEVHFFLQEKESHLWKEIVGTKDCPVTKKIEAYIGLSKEDFSKTILLPQGQFSDFLRQKPADRKEMLSKLFPDLKTVTSICAKITKDAKDAEQKLKEKQEALQKAQETFQEEENRNKIEEIEKALSAAKEKLDFYQNQIAEKSAKAEQIKTLVQNAERAQQLKEKKEHLERKAADIAQKEEQAKKAEDAKVLYTMQENAQSRKNDIALCKENLASAKERLSVAKISMQQAESQKDTYEKNKKDFDELKIKLHDTKNAQELLKDFQQAQKSAQRTQHSIEELYIHIVQDILLARQKAAQIEEDTENAKATIQKIEILLEDYQKSETEQNTRNTAESLAQHVQEGKPCPVCGNIVHFPLPVIIVNSIDFAAKRKEKQAEKAEAQKKIETLAIASKNCSDFLLRSESILETIHACAQKYQFSLANKEQLSLADRHNAHNVHNVNRKLSNSDLKERQKTVSALITDFSSAQEKIRAFSQQHIQNAETLSTLIQTLTQETEQRKEAILLYEERSKTAQTELAESEAAVTHTSAAAQEAEIAYRKCKEIFDRELEKSIFSQAEELKAAVLPEKELTALKKECAAYHTELAETNALLAENSSQYADIHQLKTELQTVQEDLQKANNESSAFPDYIKNLASQKEALRAKLQTLMLAQAELDTLLQKTEPLLRLRNDIIGKKENTKDKTPRIQFDSWVTRVYLEDIIQKANPRFKRFTNGQFTFTLREEGNNSKDLNLLVSDSYTGTERNTSSLSGGQTFMASLSLALALTDVVQERNGFITLDSLFIDEGFGSLDEKSLDTAIQILNEIREHRMVGIISHVEMLASAIESHIVVTKTPRGSTIRQH